MPEVSKTVPTVATAPDPNVQPGYKGERGTSVLPKDAETGLISPTGQQPQSSVTWDGNEAEGGTATRVSTYNTNGSYK